MTDVSTTQRNRSCSRCSNPVERAGDGLCADCISKVRASQNFRVSVDDDSESIDIPSWLGPVVGPIVGLFIGLMLFFKTGDHFLIMLGTGTVLGLLAGLFVMFSDLSNRSSKDSNDE